jgi:hypothetical protein
VAPARGVPRALDVGFDSEGKESGATAFEGADFVEGRCFGSWRWVERQRNGLFEQPILDCDASIGRVLAGDRRSFWWMTDKADAAA